MMHRFKIRERKRRVGPSGATDKTPYQCPHVNGRFSGPFFVQSGICTETDMTNIKTVVWALHFCLALLSSSRLVSSQAGNDGDGPDDDEFNKKDCALHPFHDGDSTVGAFYRERLLPCLQ